MIKINKLIVIILPLIIATSCSYKQKINASSEVKQVALIVKSREDYYWETVKMGADIAAKEFGVEINYMAPIDESDIDAQIKMVSEAVNKGVDAIILAPSDSKALVDIANKARNHKIPVIIIDSNLETDAINSFIATDNFEAGKKAGEELINLVGEKANVALMGYVKGNLTGDQRESGFLDTLSKYPNIKVVAKKYCSEDSSLATTLTKNVLSEYPNLDAIVALNSVSTIGVADAIYEMNLMNGIKIVGFDSTPKEIQYIEKNVIQATIIQNPFNMGYLSVKNASSSINSEKIEEYIDTGSKVINKENMFLPENEKFIFPFVN
ncbi:substrate-binding domain-containing protein [Clostridium grantii]|uniref:Ribose transport system substrate-binding protein n=1 Tax=Clostridium grantii DSM 8605 TaxID=1121316 RepID=A0A1M5VTV2_9CLOT|nr:substrate-binding domain-containing protein [Clostridium grantii]SHH78692.1 ribose transport system substrate-binding protein [Clostridium grantii DSM 8605]